LKNKTYTTEDYDIFVKHCEYWINKFGITEYEIDFQHSELDSVARCTYDVKAKIACFQLSKFVTYDFCEQSDLNKLALHEVLHLLLADLGYTINETKDHYSDLAISAEHAAVQRLVKAIID
jgi:hypothetical protein